jgi:CubicO group peptidase (beta-lactamase class C family)
MATAVEAWAGRAGIGGGVLGVGVAGTSRRLEPFGTVSVAGESRPAAPEHRYLLTSVTKPITGTQVLLLAQRGELDLDASVAEYLPKFAVNGKGTVTVAQLLAHTSGLDNGANLIEGPPTDLSTDELMRACMEAKLGYPPGSAWQYCSPGYWVLGALIERVSGVSWADHLARELSGPLGLASLRYEPGEPPAGYVDARAPEPQHPGQIRTSLYPAGAMVADAGDVLDFGLALLDGLAGRTDGPLAPAAAPLLTRVLGEGVHMGRPAAWTYGWQLRGPGSFQSARTLFHVGASGTALWVDPDSQTVVALLTATWWLSWRVLAELANLAFARPAGGAV